MKLDDNLILCIRQGDNEKAKKILEKVDPCDMVDSSGTTLLHIAADSKNEVMTKYLIEKGCKVNAVDDLGNTPLILASRTKDTGVISALLATDANVLITNNQGETAAKIVFSDTYLNYDDTLNLLKKVKEECLNNSLLTAEKLLEARCCLAVATYLRDVEVINYMLDNGCDVNERWPFGSGYTALHVAVMINDLENVKLLIRRGADMNIEISTVDKLSPLFYARNKNMIKLLLDHGAQLISDEGVLKGWSPVLYQNEDKEFVKMIVQRCPNFSAGDLIDHGLLNWLARNKNVDVVQILKDNMNDSFDVNRRNWDRCTFLISASKANNYNLIEFLLMKGAEVNIKDLLNQTALEYVIRSKAKNKIDQKNKLKILKLFLEYGADVQLISSRQDTLLDIALEDKNFEMIRIILERLAFMDVMDYKIKDFIRAKINSHFMFKVYFLYCKRKAENLKRNTMKPSISSLKYNNYKLTGSLWTKLMIGLSKMNCKL